VSAGSRPRYGSDLIADLLGALGLEYAAFNPGASFRGLHDSLVNHRGDSAPRTILCTHEEISVALAHGYAKATGRPMVAALHDIVGLQHACMAIFNAWVDRVPVLLLGGTGAADAAKRRPWIEWIHTALVQGDHVRDFVKWDDQPASVAAAVESVIRAYRLALSEPSAPTYVCLDVALQEDPLPEGAAIPADLARWTSPRPVQGDPSALDEAAALLAAARAPVILADRVGRTQEGVDALARLAETLAAPVVDLGARFNVPSTHGLDATGAGRALVEAADVVVLLDLTDPAGQLRRPDGRRSEPARLRPDAKVVSISMADLLVHSWSADYEPLQPADVEIVGDTRVALPALADAVAERVAAGDARRMERRRALAAAAAQRRGAWEAQARRDLGGDVVTVPALALAVRDAIGDRARTLANSDLDGWVRRLWTVEHREEWTGGSGGAGIGYGIGASLGVALARKGSGAVVVDLQPDGDLLYCTSALWTAAKERLPLLAVMHNDRAYGNSLEHARAMARERGRPVERAGIGTAIGDPAVDFATVARGLGVAAAGPVTRPADLAATLAAAVEAVSSGEPYLVDVVVPRR
jgi:thiamine pyrophosphate-dependent acetolactate synthase large subunit-like protein